MRVRVRHGRFSCKTRARIGSDLLVREEVDGAHLTLDLTPAPTLAPTLIQHLLIREEVDGAHRHGARQLE